MRAHPQIEGIRERCDFEPRSDAADAADIDLDQVDRSAFDVVAESVRGVDMLAQRDRDRGALLQDAVRTDVVGMQRFLEP
jgi:hypothetical protein